MAETITLLSWNVNGIRAVHKKGFLDWLTETAPDILCLQETRAAEAQLPAALAQPAGYRCFWNASRAKKGYSGTALLTRSEPLDVQHGLGIDEFDQEGRTIIARYPSFTLINCYFPNGGRDHSRVPFKLAFYDAFLEKCESLRAQGQAVVFCGDLNAWPSSPVYRRLQGLMSDVQKKMPYRAKPKPTFPSYHPLLRIDHIFVSENFKVLGVQVPRTAGTRQASDHLPVIADLEHTRKT